MASASPGSVTVGASFTEPWLVFVAVAVIAGSIYLGSTVSPPSLMDECGCGAGANCQDHADKRDWVTARLDGVLYLEKAPLIYWAGTHRTSPGR